eukprot:scaffold10163_cov270-Chaetoceros_neogracile.AAC.54
MLEGVSISLLSPKERTTGQSASQVEGVSISLLSPKERTTGQSASQVPSDNMKSRGLRTGKE